MTSLLVFLTVVEIVIAVAVLATYVIMVTRRLQLVSQYLAKIAFGVRAVDTQTAKIGPSVTKINGSLQEIDQVMERLAQHPPGR